MIDAGVKNQLEMVINDVFLGKKIKKVSNLVQQFWLSLLFNTTNLGYFV